MHSIDCTRFSIKRKTSISFFFVPNLTDIYQTQQVTGKNEKPLSFWVLGSMHKLKLSIKVIQWKINMICKWDDWYFHIWNSLLFDKSYPLFVFYPSFSIFAVFIPMTFGYIVKFYMFGYSRCLFNQTWDSFKSVLLLFMG